MMNVYHFLNQNKQLDYFNLGRKNMTRQCTPLTACPTEDGSVRLSLGGIFERRPAPHQSWHHKELLSKWDCRSQVTQGDGCLFSKCLHEAVLSSTQTSFSYKEWGNLTKEPVSKWLGGFLSLLHRTNSGSMLPRRQIGFTAQSPFSDCGMGSQVAVMVTLPCV